MKNWKKYGCFLLIVALIVGVVLYFHYRHKPAAVHAFTPPPAIVNLATVKVAHWPVIVTATGTVSSAHGVTIRAQVAGQIQKKLLSSGSTVKQGQAIYRIDPQGLAQLIQENKAQLLLKEAQLAEQMKLFRHNYVAKNDFDKAKEAHDVALSTLRQNQHKLLLTRVKAPFSGRLGVMLAHLGDYVKVNDPLVSLQDPDHLRVDFTVPGADAGRVAIGQKVEFSVAQYPSQQFVAHVSAVNPNVTPDTQSLLVRAYLDKTTHHIIPGAFADVRLYLTSATPTSVVPSTALVYSDAGPAIYHVVKGVAHLTPVIIGERLGDDVAVLSGVHAGDLIVSEGKIKLMDGSRVQSSSSRK